MSAKSSEALLKAFKILFPKESDMIAYYHSPCTDGSCAAWIFKQKYPDAKLIPLDYGNMNMDVIRGQCLNQAVYFLDCSLPYDSMMTLLPLAMRIVVIDHHLSFQKDAELLQKEGVNVVFDLNRCGSILTWEFCMSNTDYPLVVKYVDDRDRWARKLSDSKAVSAYIFSKLVLDFDQIEHNLQNKYGYVVEAGNVLLENQQKMVNQLVGLAIDVKYGDSTIKCVNTPVLISEVGGELAKQGKFGMTFFQNSVGKLVFSLRSEGDFNVSTIAKHLGGGGHKNAAGFTLPTWPESFIK